MIIMKCFSDFRKQGLQERAQCSIAKLEKGETGQQNLRLVFLHVSFHLDFLSSLDLAESSRPKVVKFFLA